MKMPEHIDDSMLAPCGINCVACYVHLRKKNPCPGCRAADGQPGHCGSCKIKICAQQRKVTHCFACEKFPCALNKRLDRTYQKYGVSLIENGKKAKEQGIETFLEGQRKQYRCACGGAVSCIQKTCSECGKDVNTK